MTVAPKKIKVISTKWASPTQSRSTLHSIKARIAVGPLLACYSPFVVTPLVAEGFEVLQTTRNITFLLAEIQILTVLMLFLILVALSMLLITCNPDLERERQALITPVLHWTASWVMSNEGKRRFGFAGIVMLFVTAAVAYVHYYVYFRDSRTAAQKLPEDRQVIQAEGKDVEGVKEGKSSQ